MSGAPDSPARSWARRLWLREWLLIAPSLLWVALDRTPWSWDPAWYGEVATDLWWTLLHRPAEWGQQMLGAFGIKAPGIAWLGQFLVPVGHAAGSVDDALLLVPMLAALLTVRLWFALGRELWSGDGNGGWLLALLGAGAPLFVGITHQFFVEPLQLLGITWLWWLALAAPRLPRLRVLGSALAAGALLMAAKVTSPAFAAVPALLVAWRLGWARTAWQSPTRPGRWADRTLLVAALATAGATAAWYAQNLPALRDWVVFAAQDDSSLIYGSRPEFLAKWGFWLPAVHREFFNGVAGLVLLPLAVIAGVRARRSPLPDSRLPAVIAAAAALQVALVLWGFSLQIPEITRYALPLLTPALLPVLWLLAPAAAAPRRAALALAAGQWAWSHGTPLGLLPPAPRGSEWLVRADPDPSYAATLDTLIARTTTPATAYRYFVNGYELPWLNANTLSFHAAKGRLSTGIRAYYTSLGYGANDAGAAFRRMEDMHAEGFISIESARHDPRPAFMNQVAAPVLDRVRAGPEYAPEPFENRHHIVLYRRVPSRH